MNLSAYDAVENDVFADTWINPTYKKLYSRSIKYYPYYAFLKKYNKNTKSNDYYVAMLKNTNSHVQCRSTIMNNKVIKLDLSPIWSTSYLCTFKQRTAIFIEEVEKNEDGVIYYLDI